MKIHPNNDITNNGNIGKKNGIQNQNGNAFGKALETALDNQANKQTEKTNSAEEIKKSFSISNTPPVIQGKLNLDNIEMKLPAIQNIEKLFNVLDIYRQKLSDPKITLKEIHPLVERMAAENKSLQKLVDSLPDNDSLKNIANKALITSSLEVIRFNRGDYVNQTG